MIHDQVVQISVGAHICHTQDSTQGIVVLLIELKHINVLVYAIIDLPCHSKVVHTSRAGTNHHRATWLRCQEVLRLNRIEVVEVGMINDTTPDAVLVTTTCALFGRINRHLRTLMIKVHGVHGRAALCGVHMLKCLGTQTELGPHSLDIKMDHHSVEGLTRAEETS